MYISVCELFKSIKSVIGILTAKISPMPCYLVVLILGNRQKNTPVVSNVRNSKDKRLKTMLFVWITTGVSKYIVIKEIDSYI